MEFRLKFLCAFVAFCAFEYEAEAFSAVRTPKVRIEDNDYYSRSTGNCAECVCGMNNRKMRIVGGNVTQMHEFPWMAGISKGEKLHCGAALISRRYVITAAHCIDGLDLKDLKISLGRHYLATEPGDSIDDASNNLRFKSELDRKIKNAKTYPNFNIFSFNNDIALLELDEPVEFSEILQPVCLPTKADADYSGQIGIVTGWGRVSERNRTSNVLRKVAVPIWSRQQCSEAKYGKNRITENMLCAGFHDGKKDSCKGDSGGPLHLNGENGSMQIVGIVSWGRGCARPKYPGIYTRVANYLDWIHDILGSECLCPPFEK